MTEIKTTKLYLSEAKAVSPKLILQEADTRISLSPTIALAVKNNEWDKAYKLAKDNSEERQDLVITDSKLNQTKFEKIKNYVTPLGFKVAMSKDKLLLTAEDSETVNKIKDTVEALDAKGLLSRTRVVDYHTNQTSDEMAREVINRYIDKYLNNLAKDNSGRDIIVKIFDELGFNDSDNRYMNYFVDLSNKGVSLTRNNLAALNNIYGDITSHGTEEVDEGPAKDLMYANKLFENNPKGQDLVDIVDKWINFEKRYPNAINAVAMNNASRDMINAYNKKQDGQKLYPNDMKALRDLDKLIRQSGTKAKYNIFIDNKDNVRPNTEINAQLDRMTQDDKTYANNDKPLDPYKKETANRKIKSMSEYELRTYIDYLLKNGGTKADIDNATDTYIKKFGNK